MSPSSAPPGAATRRLAERLEALGPVVVAFSGGVDSSLLTHLARGVLGRDAVLAVTADSASLATGELDHCSALCRDWDVDWLAVDTDELTDDRYVANGADRCARCKWALMDAVDPIATRRGATVVLGVNVDDLGDYRPGQHAAAQRGARFPMVEAGLTKADVRAAARERSLSVWDRPAMPCLASRVPYGTPVDVTVLARVDRAELAVRALGFRDLRVRHLGTTARLEVPLDEVPDALALRTTIDEQLTAVGYDTVVIDPDGLRSGNLNDALDPSDRVGPAVAPT